MAGKPTESANAHMIIVFIAVSPFPELALRLDNCL